MNFVIWFSLCNPGCIILEVKDYTARVTEPEGFLHHHSRMRVGLYFNVIKVSVLIRLKWKPISASIYTFHHTLR